MTSTNNLADVVRHYQRSIERHGEDETRLLHCITKLFNLPIKFEHLQETGIGKTVNALRKINGEVGVAAKTLVTKWKAMVAAEEEPKEPPPATTSEEDTQRPTSDEDQDQENKGSNSSSSGEDAPQQQHHQSKSKSKRTESSSKSKTERSHNSSGSKSHSKSRPEQEEKKHKSSRSDKSKDRDSHKSNGERKTRDSSSSASKSNHHRSHSSSSKSKHEKTKDQSEHKLSKTEKHKSSTSSSPNKSSKRARSSQRQEEDSPKCKVSKHKSKTETVTQDEAPDGFDSSMGANFDDVLGMLNMPMGNSSRKSVASSSSTKLKSISKPTITATVASSSSSRTASSTKKPELLAPTAKLEPLDPSIALELPTISNNYKPLPLNQTVMDVVFNQGGSGVSTHKPTPRNFNESEALAQGISSKTMRTKIYSGVRTGQILQVPSLFDLCTRVLQKNIDALEYTGGVPFEVLRPVLERATPQQLLNVEEYNPYLMDDSDILWQQHVQRQCRSQRREEMETWREMFLRCQEEKDRKLSILAESIKASQKISEAPVRKTQLAFVDSMVKPPRSVQRKQEQYGTNRKLIATPAARVAALSSVTPNAAKVGDARLRVLSATRDTAQVAAAPMRAKKAPLMAKTLQFIRGRHKR